MLVIGVTVAFHDFLWDKSSEKKRIHHIGKRFFCKKPYFSLFFLNFAVTNNIFHY